MTLSTSEQIPLFQPSPNSKTCLYFTVASVATTAEKAAIARLHFKYGYVVVVDGSGAESNAYGTNLIPADAIAGTSVPAAYTTAIANYPDGNVTEGAPANPETLLIVPGAAVSFSHTTTQQLYAVAADITEGGDAVVLTDQTAIGATGVWSSSDTSKATVGASTGVVTGVAAGTCNILFTLTRASGTAVVATKAITLS